jgi:hypothetical protein
VSITYLILQKSALKGPSLVQSAPLDSSLTEIEMSGRDLITRYSNITTPILSCFCFSVENRGSSSLGHMINVFGAEVVLKSLVVSSTINLKFEFRY